MRSKDRGLMEKIQTFAEQYALEHHGQTPSVQTIGAELGVSHVSAYRYLVAMDKLGMVRYSRGEIHTDLIDKINSDQQLLAVAGSIPCGPPDERQEMIEEFVSLPAIFLGKQSGNFFILKASGDSMIDAGIDDGDLVIVRQQFDAQEGDVVAALVDNHESTLKRFLLDEKGAYLLAENNTWGMNNRIIRRNLPQRFLHLHLLLSR